MKFERKNRKMFVTGSRNVQVIRFMPEHMQYRIDWDLVCTLCWRQFSPREKEIAHLKREGRTDRWIRKHFKLTGYAYDSYIRRIRTYWIAAQITL